MSSSDASRTADWLSRLLERHERGGDEPLDLALVTYGSLLHPDEITALFPSGVHRVRTVRVRGFRRRFNKPVAEHLRQPTGERRGVLNLERREDAWFNGLVIGPVSQPALEKYAFREREYGILRLSPDRISPDAPASPGNHPTYTCLLEDAARLESGLEPIPEYLDLCREGARHWGKTFLADFLRTTYVGDETLRSRGR